MTRERGVAHIGKVIDEMRKGGYYDRIMAGGPELARVQQFLRACAGEAVAPPVGGPLQRPDYPCFPGLRHKPWHSPQDFDAVRMLEAAYPAIREEALGLQGAARLDYSRAARPWRSWTRPWTLLRPDAAPGTWTVYLFHHMGVDVEGVKACCPNTRAVIAALPRACVDYPWGDFIFSAMSARSHLRPHCSIDNLRVRIHLGVSVPEGCHIRVGAEIRSWEEGRCLAFEDSFEHEVWNRSGTRRIVLIVDLWHPDLTDVEIEALTAGFRKAVVRRVFLRERIGITDAPQDYLPMIEAQIERQDDDPLLRAYWSG